MKVRASITTCDAPECDEHYIGNEEQTGWLKVGLKPAGDDDTIRLTFHSYTCLNNWAYTQAEAAGEGKTGE